MSGKITAVVRVTRTITRVIDQYVDVFVTSEPLGYPDHHVTRGKRLVEAQITAGQDICWVEASFEDEQVGTHSLRAELRDSAVAVDLIPEPPAPERPPYRIDQE
jgi:hypothetical protein